MEKVMKEWKRFEEKKDKKEGEKIGMSRAYYICT